MEIRYKTGFIAIAAVTAVMFCGNVLAAVTAVESNHNLVQLVDSGAPLHASQSMLDSACAFSNAGNIESIAVDPAANLYVQINQANGEPSSDTCIFSVDNAGVATLVNGSTGFGINTRGTDMLYDPSSGLLVTMDDNSGQFGRIATVTTSAPGTTGTYVTNPGVGFISATFGGQFSHGVGDVAAGQLVYTADVGANGIYSSGSGGPVLNHVTPPSPGDDMVIQPDGDWVHLGDGNCTAIAYNSSPPHNSTTSPVDLCTMYTNAGLNFTFGTRGAVCEATGEVYASFSGVTGGTGIFRLNESLTTATHVVTISGTEGLHDLIVGPARNGPNQSLYFTVHDGETSTEEVWELTLPECRPPIPVPVDSPWALIALVLMLVGSGIYIRQWS